MWVGTWTINRQTKIFENIFSTIRYSKSRNKIRSNETTLIMVDIYEQYSDVYLPHELSAIQHVIKTDPILGTICLLSQLGPEDQYQIQEGASRTQSFNFSREDWLLISVDTQKIWTEQGFQPLKGWVKFSDLKRRKDLPRIVRSSRNLQEIARSYLGKPYRWGGLSEISCDCSGLIYLIYQQLGKTLPRFSNGQYALAQPISPTELEEGDLIFGLYRPKDGKWKFPYGNPIHVMLYLGNDQVLESCGLPEINLVRLINFQQRFGKARSDMSNVWIFPTNSQFLITFGRIPV